MNTPSEAKAAVDPTPGVVHDFDCTHDPCRCSAATPRLTAWYERTDRSKSGDRPRVSVWWPGDPPTARLQTIGRGCRQPDVLPDGPPVAYFTLGGVEFGGYLDDMEWLIDAARDALRLVRWQAQTMATGGAGGHNE